MHVQSVTVVSSHPRTDTGGNEGTVTLATTAGAFGASSPEVPGTGLPQRNSCLVCRSLCTAAELPVLSGSAQLCQKGVQVRVFHPYLPQAAPQTGWREPPGGVQVPRQSVEMDYRLLRAAVLAQVRDNPSNHDVLALELLVGRELIASVS